MTTQEPLRSLQRPTSQQKPHLQNNNSNYIKDNNWQLPPPEIAAAPVAKRPMKCKYLDNPSAPTGWQDIYVLSSLKKYTAGTTTIEFAAMGIADPRPRVRDLRELGWRVETIQDSPQDVVHYILLISGGDQ